jgi:4-hydroxy-3-methylbut-2-en-1-yl diphosphate reductase
VAEQFSRAYLIDDVHDIDASWFGGVDTVVLTAGASAPEELVLECLDWLQNVFQAEIERRVVREEDVVFPLPRALR